VIGCGLPPAGRAHRCRIPFGIENLCGENLLNVVHV